MRIRSKTDLIAWAWLGGIVSMGVLAGWLVWQVAKILWRIVT